MKKVMTRFLKLFLVAAAAAAVWAGLWAADLLASIPDAEHIAEYRPPEAAEVLDRNGTVLTHLSGEEFRIWVPLSRISDHLQLAVLAAEDDTFFRHEGINYRASWEALKEDLKKKRFARGGSTITQQLVKNVYLTKEKTIRRKIQEAVLARRIEKILTKHRILELYLNEVEWGDGVYGAEAAARFYFDKPASDISVPEGAALAAMLVNPKRFDPKVRPARLKHRQELVLDLMRVGRLLTREEAEAARLEPLTFRFEQPAPRYVFSDEPCPIRLLRSGLGRMSGFRSEGSARPLRTTLDAGLQDYISGYFSAAVQAPGTAGDPPGVLMVTEAGAVRAMACVWNLEEGLEAVNRMREGEPGPLRDYQIVEPREIAWRNLLDRV